MGSTAQLSEFNQPGQTTQQVPLFKNLFGNQIYGNQTSVTKPDYSTGNMEFGPDMLKKVMGRMGQGLDPQTRSIMEQQGLGGISGQTQAGMDKIKSGFNNAGLSQSAKLGAMSSLYGNQQDATQKLFGNIGLAEEDARNRNWSQGLQGYLGLTGQGANIGNMKYGNELQLSNMQNAYNMNKYNIDKQNEFSWGDLLGGLLGAGGQLGGAYLGNPNLFSGSATGGG